MKVMHIITSLMTGGAEVMLHKIVRNLRPRGYDPFVVSLTSVGSIGGEMLADGVPVVALGGRAGVILPHQILPLLRANREFQPDLVHSWMYHANVVASGLVRLRRDTSRPALVTSVRGALHAPGRQKLMSRLVRRFDSRLSGRADAVIFNSRRSAEQHAAIGYAAAKSIVIPNCFDADEFRPLAGERERIRVELECGDDVLVGLVARYHPLKDHETFLRAAAVAARRFRGCRFVLVGRGCDLHNHRLLAMIRELGLSGQVITLGERRDIAAIQSALDVAVCSSVSESFPNSIGEAMACGVPCVVTDVGDCGLLVGNTGLVVPPQNPDALAAAITALATMPAHVRRDRGMQARQRIIAEYSLESVGKQFEQLYEGCMQKYRAKVTTCV